MKIKVNKELINKLKPYYEKYEKLTNKYWGEINLLEKEMSLRLKIEGLEFFHCDGDFAGIGNVERTMKLIHREELEK